MVRRVPRPRLTAWPAAGVALALVLTACGASARTAQKYCTTYDTGFDRIKREHPDVDQYTHNEREYPLAMILSLTSAYGDIVSLIGSMAEAAPDEIQTDVQKVHDILQKQLDSVGDAVKNPLGALAQSLVTSFTSSGSFSRTDAYTLEHCGEHIFTASPQ